MLNTLASRLSHRPSHIKMWHIAWPMIISNITVPLLGLVDTGVLGHLDNPVHLGAAAIGANIFVIIFWAFGFLKMSTTGMTAQAFGARDYTRLKQILIQNLLLATLIGAIILILQELIFSTGIKLIGGSTAVQSHAAVYCDIRAWAAPATLVQYTVIGWLIGIQKTRLSLLILVVVNSVNILMDILLVVVVKMDIAGVALATVIAEYAGIALSLMLVLKQFIALPETRKLKTNRLFAGHDLKKLFAVNSDLFIRTCSLLFAFAFFTSQGARQGDSILAANAVLLTFLLLISSALDGFANAAEALIGESVGARTIKSFHQDTLIALFWCLLTTLLLMITFSIAGKVIIRTLTDIPSVISTASAYLPWLIWMPLISNLSYLLDGVFIGATKTREMRNIMLLSLFMIFIPFWYATRELGNNGLWLTLSAFMLCRSLGMAWSYYEISKRKAWF